jgi:hypothetical protein
MFTKTEWQRFIDEVGYYTESTTDFWNKRSLAGIQTLVWQESVVQTLVWQESKL